MSAVKHTTVLIATSSAADGVYVISQGEERKAIGTVRAPRSLVDTMCAAPDLLEALERSAEGWANALELKLIPPQHRDTATILRDEARAAIARARGEQSPNHSDQKEVGNG